MAENRSQFKRVVFSTFFKRALVEFKKKKKMNLISKLVQQIQQHQTAARRYYWKKIPSFREEMRGSVVAFHYKQRATLYEWE